MTPIMLLLTAVKNGSLESNPNAISYLLIMLTELFLEDCQGRI